MNFNFYKLFLFVFQNSLWKLVTESAFLKKFLLLFGGLAAKNKPVGILSFLGELRNKTEVSLLLPLYS